MTNDARVDAWVAAWSHAQAAQQIVRAVAALPPERIPDEMPENYWGNLQSAAVYASLAHVQAEIGEGAAAALADIERRRRDDRRRITEALGRLGR